MAPCQIESGQGELDFKGEGKAAEANGDAKPKRARKPKSPQEAFAQVAETAGKKAAKASEGNGDEKPKRRGRKPKVAEATA